MVATSFHYDPYSIEAMRNPQPLYRVLREDHPAYYMPDYDSWAFSRFEDCWAILNDSVNFSTAEGEMFAREQLLQHNAGPPRAHRLDPMDIFLNIDPPVHTKFRQVTAAPFLKGNVNKLADDIRQITRRRLDTLIERGEFDFHRDFAGYVGACTMCMITGMALDEAEHVASLVHQGMEREPDTPGFTERGRQFLGQIYGKIGELLRRRRAGESPPNRLLDALINTDMLGRPLTDADIMPQVNSIIVGGVESLPKVITGGIALLEQLPDQLAAIRADLDARIAPAFEEMLRLCAPAQWFGRTVARDVEVGGVALRPGQRVLMLLASSNRDPREFDGPEEFRWNRNPRRLISFGMGAHFCIGIHVARMEGQIMLREFLERVERWTCLRDQGHWAVSEFQIGWTSLPIRIEARR
ncbi:cytochrome P450 [Sphingomonas montanisoli]|nr:cytochrome P450 [Sphingomonas montanisoli]